MKAKPHEVQYIIRSEMLVSCYECKNSVSTDAPACPHCGAPVRQTPHAAQQPKSKTTGCGVGGCGCLVVLLILGWGISQIPDLPATKQAPTVARRQEAKSKSKTKPETLIKKLIAFGMKPVVQWKKSKADPGWIGIYNCFVDPDGKKTDVSANDEGVLYNEINCMIEGGNANSMSLITIEAELYDRLSEDETRQLASELVATCFPKCPSSVATAFAEATNLKVRENRTRWEVQKKERRNGYDIVLTCKSVLWGNAPATAKAEPPREYEPQVGLAFVMTQRIVKNKLKSPGEASFGSVFSGDWQNPEIVTKYLGDRIYETFAWVDADNGFGGTVRTKFVCRIKHNEDDTWKGVSLKFDE